MTRLSDTDWIVMNAVWEHSPATAREVLERIEGDTGWAYTTVKTLLDRLVDKQVLRVRKRANTRLYEPIVTRDLARRSAVRSLVDRAFDGTVGSLVQHLVADRKLSVRDRKALDAMLRELDGKGR